MQAEIVFWQVRSVATPLFFHAGQRPMPPGKVYDTPFWSFLTASRRQKARSGHVGDGLAAGVRGHKAARLGEAVETGQPVPKAEAVEAREAVEAGQPVRQADTVETREAVQPARPFRPGWRGPRRFRRRPPSRRNLPGPRWRRASAPPLVRI